MVKELPQWRGALGAAGLLAVEAVQMQIEQHGQAVEEVHPGRRISCECNRCCQVSAFLSTCHGAQNCVNSGRSRGEAEGGTDAAPSKLGR